MELIIKYRTKSGNGVMNINVESFLEMRSISKFKKLLKVIDMSDTPDAKEQLKAYIVEYLETIETRLKDYYNKGAKACTEYKEKKPELQRLIYQRDIYKKNTPPYKECMEKVKNKREELRHLKAVWKSQESYFNKTLKNKEFYKKCLDLL